MKRSNLYDVPKDAYLFQATLQRSAPNVQEEPVRQWCAYELIRAYGYPVTSLQFEHPVKVGSKNYSIDVALLREGRPWLVVECKEPNWTQHDKALEQGQSYADASTIHAEYVLYTNGANWLVRRKVKDLWLPMDDLPRWSQGEIGRDLIEIFENVYELNPIFLKRGTGCIWPSK